MQIPGGLIQTDPELDSSRRDGLTLTLKITEGEAIDLYRALQQHDEEIGNFRDYLGDKLRNEAQSVTECDSCGCSHPEEYSDECRDDRFRY